MQKKRLFGPIFLFSLIGTIAITIQASAGCFDTDSNGPSDSNRKECLEKAQFILPAHPESKISTSGFRSLLSQPTGKKVGLENDSVVYCRYVSVSQNGNSAKFRCAQTDSKNRLYDTKGNVVAGAGLVQEGDDFYLADSSGQKMMATTEDGKTKARKAQILKVRYYDGSPRNVENYTSSAASRVLWALGIPAHTNYMTEKVVCFGCESKPFEQGKPSKGVSEFVDASIEVKFAGERLYAPTENAWTWAELNQLAQHASNETRREIEILALASNLVGVTSSNNIQHAIVCQEFSKAKECLKTIAMIHDIGAAFGSRDKGPFGGTSPRGDINAYEKVRVFKKGTCEFSYSDGGKALPLTVSKQAQQEFMRRAQALTPENLKTIFRASHIGNYFPSSPKSSGNSEWSDPGTVSVQPSASDLVDRWVRAVSSRLAEIQSAPCH